MWKSKFKFKLKLTRAKGHLSVCQDVASAARPHFRPHPRPLPPAGAPFKCLNKGILSTCIDSCCRRPHFHYLYAPWACQMLMPIKKEVEEEEAATAARRQIKNISMYYFAACFSFNFCCFHFFVFLFFSISFCFCSLLIKRN